MRLATRAAMRLTSPRSPFRVPAAWDPRVVRDDAPEAAEQREAATWWVKAAVLFALVSLTFLDRFGLRLSDAYSIGPALIGLYVMVFALLVSGAARLGTAGAMTYVLVFAVTATSYLLAASDDQRGFVSIGSLLLLLVLYAPLLMSLSKDVATVELWQWTMAWYLRFSLVIAVFGIVQFYAQFVIHAPWVFDFRLMIPAAIRGSGNYNTLNPAGELLKANGFFLREASGYSFFMAFALLCEMNMRRRKLVMGIFALGIMLSYSGSGLLALGVAMMFQASRRFVAQAAVALVLCVVVFSLFGEALHLNYTVDRLSEFDSSATKSSAYCRFIAPGKLAAEQINSGPWTALLGHGPGTTQKMYDVCETTYGKVIFEYGLVGAIALSIMIIAAINRSRMPLRLRVMLVIEWFLLGGNLLAPEPLLVIFFLSAMWPTKVGLSLPLMLEPANDPSVAHVKPGRSMFHIKPQGASGSCMFKLS